MHSRAESASSSQIEQLTTSAKQLALAGIDEGDESNALTVVGNVRAMAAALRLADDISERSILAMHRALMLPQRGFPDGDAGPIVGEFARASRIAAATGARLVDDLSAQLEGSRATMKGIRSDAAAWTVLPALVGQPAVNTKYLRSTLGLGEMAALRALDALTARGVLTETTGRVRGRVWRHRGILDVLDGYAAEIRRMSVR